MMTIDDPAEPTDWLALLTTASDMHASDQGPTSRPALSLLIEAVNELQTPSEIGVFLDASIAHLSLTISDSARTSSIHTGQWRIVAECLSRLRLFERWHSSQLLPRKERLAHVTIGGLDTIRTIAASTAERRALYLPNTLLSPIGYLHLNLVYLSSQVPQSYLTLDSGFFAASPVLALDTLQDRDMFPAFVSHLYAYAALGWLDAQDVGQRIINWSKYLELTLDRRRATMVMVGMRLFAAVGVDEPALKTIYFGSPDDQDHLDRFLGYIYSEDEIRYAILTSQSNPPHYGLSSHSFLDLSSERAAQLIGQLTDRLGLANSVPIKDSFDKARAAFTTRYQRGPRVSPNQPVQRQAVGVGGAGSEWAGSRSIN